jgi:hypothetical protein
MNAKINGQMRLTARTTDFGSNNHAIMGESNHLELLNDEKSSFNATHIDVLSSPP